MSFDIFVLCLRSGEPKPIPRDIFDSIFAPHDTNPAARKSDPGYMVVEYPDGSGGAIYCGGDTDETRCQIMFNHCGGDAFFADMYALAQRTRSIIYWPDEKAIYLYTDETVPAELNGCFEGARSVLVRSGADIVKAIRNS